jgi:hypothetical protein
MYHLPIDARLNRHFLPERCRNAQDIGVVVERLSALDVPAQVFKDRQ